MIYPDSTLACFSPRVRDLLECARWWERNYPELYWAVTACFDEDAGRTFCGIPDYVDKELFEYYRKELNK